MEKPGSEAMNILIVDDEEKIRSGLSQFLNKRSFNTFQTGLPSEAFAIMENNNIDIVLLDIRLPEMDGLDALKKIKAINPETEVIMISGYGEMKSVIAAMRNGAIDFFQKPLTLAEVQRAIENTQRYHDLNRKLMDIELKYNTIISSQNQESRNNIFGTSPGLKKVLDLMKRVAETDSTSVLITGESGTGKELIAKGIHFLSRRQNEIFCPVNCSAITESLFESEFFGYTQGAFTGAMKNKSGLFEAANNGTIFLDEIGDLPYALQPKLLRVLEERRITKVGSHKGIPVNVRVIAATNQDIEKLIAEKKFREDLFYRLNTFVIHVPPLRERKEDILILFENFLNYFATTLNKKISRVDEDLYDLLLGYSFPGNVRELKNMVERAVILTETSVLKKEYFQIIASRPQVMEIPVNRPGNNYNLDEAEKQIIIQALDVTSNNKNKAAKLLNISWQSLDRRLKKFKLSN